MTEADFSKISKHDTPEESPGFLLWRTSVLWRRAIEETLKSFDLTHPQFVILATTGWLTRNGKKASQAEIGRQAALDPNTTSQILRGLQTKGLIQRIHSSDERTKHPILTKKGLQILEQALPSVEKCDRHFFSRLDVEKSGLLSSLQLLAQSDR
jgi:MarR family transcriptional regulator, organic hydroperoxide resistance regulator